MSTKSKPFQVNPSDFARMADAFCCGSVKVVVRWNDGSLGKPFCGTCQK